MSDKLGWIKLHRKIQDNELWKERRKFSRAEAWIDILMEVQHSETPTTILLGNVLLECKRGESLKSLETWAFRWGWTKSSVRRFLELLQNMKQICFESATKTTRISVCNYDTYNGERNASETQVKRKRNANETHLEPDKNVENEKNEEEIPDCDSLTPKQEAAIPECLATVEGFSEAFAAWVEFRTAKRAKATDRVKATILKRLAERPEQAVAALDTCMAAGWTDVKWDWIDNRNKAQPPKIPFADQKPVNYLAPPPGKYDNMF